MKFDEYINDGIHIGDGFHMARATIVGPYPTREFVEQVLSWGPDEIVLAVDDGWPQERIEDIALACHETETKLLLRRVAPADRTGLVHAKLYLFDWTNDANSYHRHVLLAGSANASRQGFGTHAEAFVHIDLANINTPDKKAALQYFGALADGRDVPITKFYVLDKSWLSLPSLRIVHSAWPNGFDAWIRRGRLCHKYQADPSFGRLVLRLKKPMPQDVLGENLGNSGFSVVGETQTFSRPYVVYESDNEIERQTWRQRYFTETDYGYWTSAECFSELQKEFVAAKADSRQRALDNIRAMALGQRGRWIADFLDSIQDVFAGLSATQREAYFEVKANGELDDSHYRRQAETKLGRDREKSMDSYFCSRFIAGFAFPLVPPLGDEFNEFVLILCANLLAKIQSRQIRNWLAIVLRNHEIADSSTTADELLFQLRTRWDDLKPELIEFFRRENC